MVQDVSKSVSKSAWDPALYLEFADDRARPADDLMARLNLDVAGGVMDLGCGPGNLTVKLKQRWPTRPVTGLDSSSEMLTKARTSPGAGNITWTPGDISAWSPSERFALVFANAALHWVPDHASIFPRLMHAVAAGGRLAVQMPMTGKALYHDCIRRVLALPHWRDRLAGVRSHDHPLKASAYYDFLAPLSSHVDIWETTYHHVLADKFAVTAWIAGAALVPYLDLLDTNEKARFLGDYTDIAATAYPPHDDGRVLFQMRRIFMIAKRR